MLRVVAIAAVVLGADAFSTIPSFSSALGCRSAITCMRPQEALQSGGVGRLGMTMAASKDIFKAPSSAFKPMGSGPGKKEEVKLSPEWRLELPEPLMESEVGTDFIPLLTALKLGRYEEADQLTRDMLITLGGAGPKKRNYVYFAEAPNLPLKDMMTIDRLWVAYSNGKFGYSVQKQIWNAKDVNGDFPKFCAKIEWTTGPCGGCTKICSGCTGTLKRWTPEGQGGNQYEYNFDKAKKGHLPLTSALRGTYLLRSILGHKAFGSEPVKGLPLVKASSSGDIKTGAAAVNEPLMSMEELRFGMSPYEANRKPWDMGGVPEEDKREF